MDIIVKSVGRGRFDALVDGRMICSSRQPFFAAARVLQSEGVPDDTVITMFHDGSATAGLTSTVGHAALMTVVENDKVGPRLGRFRAMDADMRFAVTTGEAGSAENIFQAA